MRNPGNTHGLTPVKKLVLSAMFLALGLVLPFFTGQIPEIGSMLLPMHIPVLLCGMILGGPGGWWLASSAPCCAPPCFPCRPPIRAPFPWPLNWRLTVLSAAYCTAG